ncbi:hypothetical protein [Alloalcanivorax mobilis]|uniref:hypothetical protein n=1 Tax=Alloalcanivorax mobilis TaxID=2019569 RepID=UPI000C76CA1A|nr:hypothetical protein [Alloalcanivorax mobilis]
MATKKPEKTETPATDGQHAKPEPKPEPIPEKPDYSALEAIAGEDSANDDYKPEPGGDKPEPASVGAKELAMLYHMVYGVAAARLGAHWAITETEANDLGRATDAVLAKYGARMAMGPEFTLVMTAAIITAPRAMLTLADRGKKPDEKPKQAEPASLEAGDGGQ